MTSNSHCIYCHTIFLTAKSFGQHLLKKHALPVWDGSETTYSAAPTESAFRGKLRPYNLKVGEKELDLLQVMMQNKEEIDALILERVKEGPNKVQFHVEVGMIKIPTVQDGDSENFERTMLFLNTKTLTVYFEGIAGDQFLELVEHMVNQVNSFSSHGSGWIIDRIEKLQISFAVFSSIRAGSYLELLSHAISAASTLLTNINTKDDDRCFLYCFVAAYNNVNEPALYPTSRRWLEKNKISTYDLDLYLTTDVLLLASVFEAFREICYQTYGLDCACYFLASNLSGDAFLKVCKPELKLLTDREHLDFVQRMIRGGMSSVYARRFYKATNKYLDNFSPSEPSSYILNIDANNLYAGIMKNCPLPLNDFSIVEKSLTDILLTSEISEWGYIVEVNLTIPEELHDFFADYPLAPSHEVVDICAMSNKQVDMLGKVGITTLPKVPKLLQTLHPKEGYVLHYLTLKLYHELGMKITHLGKVFQLRQSHWMAPFVDLNTRLRKAAVKKFQENFYKLNVNSAFGKTMESKLGRKKPEIVRNEREFLQKNSSEHNEKLSNH